MRLTWRAAKLKMTQKKPFLTLGTRGSPLAMAQAHQVRTLLAAAHDVSEHDIIIDVISVAGDRIQDRPLSEIGGKGLFTEEIEQRLSDGRIDIAVHSSKDMPTKLPDGLELAHFLPREDVRDGFVSHAIASFDSLPDGATVGTSSLRRAALVRRLRPDLNIVGFRGNVGTRLQKLQDGVAGATFLACAGLNRLGKGNLVTEALDVERFPPRPARVQSALKPGSVMPASKPCLNPCIMRKPVWRWPASAPFWAHLTARAARRLPAMR